MLDVSFLLDDFVIYASNSPYTFLLCVLLVLSPFFAVSSYLSWQLADEVDIKYQNWKMRLVQYSWFQAEHDEKQKMEETFLSE